MTTYQSLLDHQSRSMSPLSMSPPSIEEEIDEELKAKQQEEFSNEDDEEEAEKDEFVFVNLADIRNEIQCPVCLGILCKTRTFKECLHRFCRECIDKSMRLGKKECPVCRTHYPSRRSLRDDLNYDVLIASLYPDIDNYGEEEWNFPEYDKCHNKKIQAKIAETVQKQTEASGKRKALAKATARNTKHKRTRGESNALNTSLPESEEEEDVKSNNQIDYSSADERSSNNSREKRFSSFKAENEEMPVWGRSCVRSQIRHDSPNVEVTGRLIDGGGGRISKLLGHFHSLQENDDEFELHLRLLPKDEHNACSLERPYICCQPAVSIGQLCEFVALQTSVNPQDVGIFGTKPQIATEAKLELPKESELLELHETLGGLRDLYGYNKGDLVLKYEVHQQSS